MLGRDNDFLSFHIGEVEADAELAVVICARSDNLLSSSGFLIAHKGDVAVMLVECASR